MKKLFKAIVCMVAVSTIMISCSDEQEEIEVKNTEMQQEIEETIRLEPFTDFVDEDIINGRTASSPYYDPSGQIELKIFSEKYGPTQTHPMRSVSVDNGYVCVGGGAYVQASGPGGLLTASYPGSDKETWYARSKDHHGPDAHYLTVYAIGMKLNGISESQLKSYISHFTWPSSQSVSRPSNAVTIPSNYEVLSGGVRINWSGSGNLLVASLPYTAASAWIGYGKDHMYSSPASMDIWAVGILDNIPGFGQIDTKVFDGTRVFPGGGGGGTSINISSQGYATTGVGAEAMSVDEANDWNAHPGRLPYGMIPRTWGASAYSKDHFIPDDGTLYVFGVGIKKL